MPLIGLIKDSYVTKLHNLKKKKSLESQIREASWRLFSFIGDKSILQITTLTLSALEGKVLPPEMAQEAAFEADC